MSELLAETSLDHFIVDREAAFDALRCPLGGLVLVELSDGLDPQGLISKLAEIVDRRGLTLSDRSNAGKFRYLDPDDLMARGEAPDKEALDFENRKTAIFTAIEDLMGEIFGDRVFEPTKRFHQPVLHASRNSDRFTMHPDSSMATVWLGMSKPGLSFYTQYGTVIRVDQLPPNHVMIARQSGWNSYVRPLIDGPFCQALNHEVEWQATEVGETRVVGIDFIG